MSTPAVRAHRRPSRRQPRAFRKRGWSTDAVRRRLDEGGNREAVKVPGEMARCVLQRRLSIPEVAAQGDGGSNHRRWLLDPSARRARRRRCPRHRAGGRGDQRSLRRPARRTAGVRRLLPEPVRASCDPVRGSWPPREAASAPGTPSPPARPQRPGHARLRPSGPLPGREAAAVRPLMRPVPRWPAAATPGARPLGRGRIDTRC